MANRKTHRKDDVMAYPIEEIVSFDDCDDDDEVDEFELEDIENRKLYITNEIEKYMSKDIVRHILQYNAEDKGVEVSERKPIFIYISTYGGETDAGGEIVDAILTSKTPVYTINFGISYSMGFLIGLAGHRKYAMPNSKFLLHEGNWGGENSVAKMRDYVVFNDKLEEKWKEYIAKRSKITVDELNEKTRHEWYMFADEAKERGVVEFIIGENCDLDEVV